MNPQLAGRVHAYDFALSDINGAATISMCSSISDGKSSGSHLVVADTPENADAYRDFEHVTIQTRTGDHLIADDSTLRPDLLKIDVEGAEALVLLGCRTLLLTHRPRLLVEVHHILAMYDCLQLLGECGYQVRVLDRANGTQS